VAALAGVPAPVIRLARAHLEALERLPSPLPPENEESTPQLGLFNNPPEPKAMETLRNIDPDDCTPRHALELLYRMQREIDKEP
jgi:DNA mismatch repair protein MutS